MLLTDVMPSSQTWRTADRQRTTCYSRRTSSIDARHDTSEYLGWVYSRRLASDTGTGIHVKDAPVPWPCSVLDITGGKATSQSIRRHHEVASYTPATPPVKPGTVYSEVCPCVSVLKPERLLMKLW